MKNKKIIVAVTGGIAAYKTALIVRLLIKEGAEVQVVMTEKAKDFITPLTLSVLSKRPVYSDFFEEKTGEWNSHVELGLWADAILVAPATAVTMAKMANGMPDNLVSAVYMSARCPVFFAPAMDLDMYVHQSARENVVKLSSYGNHIIEAESGELASGLHGCGRMAEPENILSFLQAYFKKTQNLLGQTVMLTAGPTEENIDPVRFIGNRSTGKMGFALAEALAEQGAKVELISGPVELTPKHENIHITKVKSAEEMFTACENIYKSCNIAVFAAAVADYTPAFPTQSKIKKKGDSLNIELKPTKDIAAEMGKLKTKNQINIGFALETDDELLNAEKKLKKKNFDFVVLNSLKDKGAGFGFDTNKVSIVFSNNNIKKYELKSKTETAQDIVNEISTLISNIKPHVK